MSFPPPSVLVRAMELHHLVLIVGPSGAGKSTLLDQISSGKVPDCLRGFLPEGIRDWPQYAGGKSRQWLASVVNESRSRGLDGVIIHYELTREPVLRSGYSNDRALDIIRLARNVLIVNIRADQKCLARQLAFKETGTTKLFSVRRRILGWKTLFRILDVLNLATRILPDRFGATLRNKTKAAWRKSGRVRDMSFKWRRYQEPGWLDQLWNCWFAYLGQLELEGVELRKIFIQPILEPDTMQPGWQLTEVPKSLV